MLSHTVAEPLYILVGDVWHVFHLRVSIVFCVTADCCKTLFLLLLFFFCNSCRKYASSLCTFWFCFALSRQCCWNCAVTCSLATSCWLSTCGCLSLTVACGFFVAHSVCSSHSSLCCWSSLISWSSYLKCLSLVSLSAVVRTLEKSASLSSLLHTFTILGGFFQCS